VPLNSDAAGDGMTVALYFFIAVVVGIVMSIIVFVLLKNGAGLKTIIVVSLIPVVLFTVHILLIHYRDYSFQKYLEKVNAMDNPFKTIKKEVLIAKLQAGENIDKTNEKGQTLLHYAAYNADLELMKFAVENGANVNKKDGKGLTAASYISPDGRKLLTEDFNPWPLFTYLAENGAVLIDVREGCENDCPLIFYAAQYAGAEEISMLLQQGANVNTSWSGKTPLFTVWYGHKAEKAQVLIDAGADVNFKSDDDYIPKPVFAYLNDDDLDILKLLIKAGADIEVRNVHGNTPLLAATGRYSAHQVAVFLLNCGADIQVKNNENDAPLLLAARSCDDAKLLKMLVERGADKDATGNEGKTAYDIALDRGVRDIEFLKP
jgi:ankyrin repeat protein